MRLQVAVHRHTLPPVHLIFNTASSGVTAGQPIHTISDLLASLSAVVPLESSDGEWGLEEYTVEVAATADQDKVYECLHYQLVTDVLREDDEVTVRGLTTDEIRERRRGGRLQIAVDGKRLLDGVPWGRRFRPLMHRPDVIIPPRKRRRIMLDESVDLDADNENEKVLHLDYPPAVSKEIGTIVEDSNEDEDSDDEFDDDYNDSSSEDESESQDESDNEDDLFKDGVRSAGPKQPREIAITADFDDADSEVDEDGSRHLVEAEVERLLAEAAELGKSSSEQSAEIGQPTTKKRKRRNKDKSVTFGPVSMLDKPAQKLTTIKLGSYPVIRQINGAPDDTSSDDSSLDSDSDSESSFGNTTSDSDSSASDSDEESSEEDTSSSSSDSDSPINKLAVVTKDARTLANKKMKVTKEPEKAPVIARANKPPGTGTVRTKKNNGRAKRKKRLQHLKAMGLLPPEADYEALKRYDATLSGTVDTGVNELPDTHMERNISATSLDARRKEVLSRLNGLLTDEAHGVANEPQVTSTVHATSPNTTSGQTENATTNGGPDAQTPTKRVRLDVQSSRRMLFNSLGLRTPKTKAAEDALREKLKMEAQQAPGNRVKSHGTESTGPKTIASNDLWKTKLIISAVECVDEGRKLPPPPFPFKQRWYEKVPKNSHGNEAGIEAIGDDSVHYDEVENNHDVTGVNHGPKRNKKSTALSAETNGPAMDDMPEILEFEKLKDLQENDVVAGAIIAYKELHMNARFEPEESNYRIGSIMEAEGTKLQILLSKRDRRELSSSTRFDDNGQRIYHGFELPDEDNDADDGTRDMTFNDLLRPKLVKPANIEVAVSPVDMAPDHARLRQDSMLVPESAPFQTEGEQSSFDLEPIENNTSQKKQIPISKQNFDPIATDDDSFLQPIDPRQNMASSTGGAALSGAGLDKDPDMMQINNPSGVSSCVDQPTSASSAHHLDRTARSTTNGETGSDQAAQNTSQYGSDNSTRAIPQTEQSKSPKNGVGLHHKVVNGSDLQDDSHAIREFNGSRTDMAELNDSQISSEDFYNAQDMQQNASSINESQPSEQESQQTRSSPRIAKTKIEHTSPAANMMRSALAGLGKRKNLQGKKKSKT